MSAERLVAPFPYFGGKRRIVDEVWSRFGDVRNYIEPFCGSAAMLLGAPDGKRVETINDLDGFVANFWRAVANDPEGVARWADYPVNEIDLEARHAWLVARSERLRWSLEDPDYYDVKIAGWWLWGACAWIGTGWCSGTGGHYHTGAHFGGNAGRGINRKLPHLGNAGRGINRVTDDRSSFILDWMTRLHTRLRDVRVACGSWERVLGPCARYWRTNAVFLDPPYAKGSMDYAAGGTGTDLSAKVRAWCVERGSDPKLRIALCGHAGEHDELDNLGWDRWAWRANAGYSRDADGASKSETIWFSPHCVKPASGTEQGDLI